MCARLGIQLQICCFPLVSGPSRLPGSRSASQPRPVQLHDTAQAVWSATEQPRAAEPLSRQEPAPTRRYVLPPAAHFWLRCSDASTLGFSLALGLLTPGSLKQSILEILDGILTSAAAAVLTRRRSSPPVANSMQRARCRAIQNALLEPPRRRRSLRSPTRARTLGSFRETEAGRSLLGLGLRVLGRQRAPYRTRRLYSKTYPVIHNCIVTIS